MAVANQRIRTTAPMLTAVPGRLNTQPRLDSDVVLNDVCFRNRRRFTLQKDLGNSHCLAS